MTQRISDLLRAAQALLTLLETFLGLLKAALEGPPEPEVNTGSGDRAGAETANPPGM